MSENREEIREMYKQQNEHLREQDRKRDQIIGFYGAVIGVIIGGIGILSKIQYIYFAEMMFIIASCILSFVLMDYVKWHTIYSYSVNSLQSVMFTKKEITKDTIKKIVSDKLQIAGTFKFGNYWKKTETKIFNLYLLISSLNFFIFGYLLFHNMKNLNYYIKWIIIGIIICIISYIVIFNYLLYRSLKNNIYNSMKNDNNVILNILDIF